MSSIGQLKTQAVMVGKQLWYGSRGQPITLGGHTLRYLVGSRPVRLRYANGGDGVARNDAKQMQYFLDHIQPGQLVPDVGAHRANTRFCLRHSLDRTDGSFLSSAMWMRARYCDRTSL